MNALDNGLFSDDLNEQLVRGLSERVDANIVIKLQTEMTILWNNRQINLGYEAQNELQNFLYHKFVHFNFFSKQFLEDKSMMRNQ